MEIANRLTAITRSFYPVTMFYVLVDGTGRVKKTKAVQTYPHAHAHARRTAGLDTRVYMCHVSSPHPVTRVSCATLARKTSGEKKYSCYYFTIMFECTSKIISFSFK